MKMWRRIVFLLVGLVLLSGCVDYNKEEERMESKPASKNTTSIESKDESKEITMAAIGDILIHGRVYRDAKIKDGYDFKPMLKDVKPFLNDTTITFANQESVMGGRGDRIIVLSSI